MYMRSVFFPTFGYAQKYGGISQRADPYLYPAPKQNLYSPSRSRNEKQDVRVLAVKLTEPFASRGSPLDPIGTV